MGDLEKANEQAKEAIKEAKGLGVQDPRLVKTLTIVGHLNQSQGRHMEAERLFKWMVAIVENVLEPEQLAMTSPLNALAGLYWKQGRWSEAEPLYSRVLAIVEKGLGTDHPFVPKASAT